MIKECEGIVIRQTRITGGRRMVLIFTRSDGKISAGTHISEKSKSASALALRPFSFGHYTISEKHNDLLTITAAETINSHFALGENADRYSEASFVLEFTDKLLPDGIAAPDIFDLLRDYLDMICIRKTDFRLLTISYMIKVMQELGIFPDMDSSGSGELLSELNDDIFNTIMFIAGEPFCRMNTLTLEESKEKSVFVALKSFAQKHLDLGSFKSERMLG